MFRHTFLHRRSTTAYVSIYVSTLCLASPPVLYSYSRPPLHLKYCSLHNSVSMEDYCENFSKRMSMAGLKAHHRIAIGVSGGPDSMALCILASNWKLRGGTRSHDGFIEGLLGIIVDHRLRAESSIEADVVFRRVSAMEIKCEVVRCSWPEGKPRQGNLQEAAREMRYQILQDCCIRNNTAVLFTAHHADDQAELSILRLSRCSGVLGLAGMPFISHLFPKSGALCGTRMLLVRPLLEFLKEDMYKICRDAHQEWVEDPSNESPLFVRNRIRMSLKIQPSWFIHELHALIYACRKTRSCVEQISRDLLSKVVTLTNEGYAIIDGEMLTQSNVEDICLSKFISSILQFISQRFKHIRGSVMKLSLDYIRNYPCKSSLTAGGCYLCAAPGSKGTRILICCSVNSPALPKLDLLDPIPFHGEDHFMKCEVDEIAAEGKLYVESLLSGYFGIPFLTTTSSESVLSEARRRDIIQESTLDLIHCLQNDEMQRFNLKTEFVDDKSSNEAGIDPEIADASLRPGQVGYFMNRFVVTWNVVGDVNGDGWSCSDCCGIGVGTVVKVRHMVDADWLYLASLLRCAGRKPLPCLEGTVMGSDACCKHMYRSAERALRSLKSIPVAARRSLPVLVNHKGAILSIPNIGFTKCPFWVVSAVFMPRVPLGGGHSIFI